VNQFTFHDASTTVHKLLLFDS